MSTFKLNKYHICGMETIGLTKRSLPKTYGSIFLALILLILMNGQAVFAQSNFTEGYIVDQSKDTTFGYIDYQEWIQIPDSIYFRKEIDLKTTGYGAGELTSFYVAGEAYVSAEVSIDLTAKEVRPQFMRTESEPKSKTERVFLQVLVKGGHVSLYMYHGNRENFYINKGDGYMELISHEFVVNRGGQYLLDSESKLRYMAQLQSVLPECAEVYGEKSPSYSSKFLITYILDCNQFVGVETGYIFQTKETVIKHGAVVGTGIIRFNGQINDKNYMYRSSRNFTLGYTADFVLPRGRERKTISAKFLYTYMDAKADGAYTESSLIGGCGAGCLVYQQDTYERISIGYLKFDVTYSYKYLAKGPSPVLLLGASIGKIFPNKTKGMIERHVVHVEGNSRSIHSTTKMDGNKFEADNIIYNIHAGIGFAYRKLMISLIYEPNPEFQDLKVLTSEGLHLRVKYLFGK
ncbi:MAG: hypothetical protein JXR20_01105 [Balneola sp.]